MNNNIIQVNGFLLVFRQYSFLRFVFAHFTRIQSVDRTWLHVHNGLNGYRQSFFCSLIDHQISPINFFPALNEIPLARESIPFAVFFTGIFFGFASDEGVFECNYDFCEKKREGNILRQLASHLTVI